MVPPPTPPRPQSLVPFRNFKILHFFFFHTSFPNSFFSHSGTFTVFISMIKKKRRRNYCTSTKWSWKYNNILIKAGTFPALLLLVMYWYKDRKSNNAFSISMTVFWGFLQLGVLEAQIFWCLGRIAPFTIDCYPSHLSGSTDILENVKVLVTRLCPALCYPMDCSCQAPLSIEIL